nr:hypothetical protein Iba_chr14fCG9140 [Ipomoea batatas]
MIKNIARKGLIFKEITLTPEPETAVSDPVGLLCFEFGGRGESELLCFVAADGDVYGSGGTFSLGNLCFRLLPLEFGSGGVGHFCNCLTELGFGEFG